MKQVPIRKLFRLLGVASTLGYMIPILFAWILASTQGYISFEIREQVHMIKHLEWVLGMIGILALIDIYIETILSIPKAKNK